jgi:hypothetical protein
LQAIVEKNATESENFSVKTEIRENKEVEPDKKPDKIE